MLIEKEMKHIEDKIKKKTNLKQTLIEENITTKSKQSCEKK